MTSRLAALRSEHVLIHTGILAALIGFYVFSEMSMPEGVPDANIGGGLALLMLFGLGFPWTIPAWFGLTSWPLTLVVVIVGSLLNLAIHLGGRLALWPRGTPAKRGCASEVSTTYCGGSRNWSSRPSR